MGCSQFLPPSYTHTQYTPLEEALVHQETGWGCTVEEGREEETLMGEGRKGFSDLCHPFLTPLFGRMLGIVLSAERCPHLSKLGGAKGRMKKTDYLDLTHRGKSGE